MPCNTGKLIAQADSNWKFTHKPAFQDDQWYWCNYQLIHSYE